uniref:C3H1-type domain-containing protein n=1 Tax=Meloidogyne hapla TaxID=6305 RepID=A0A1I8BTM5_MELHA
MLNSNKQIFDNSYNDNMIHMQASSSPSTSMPSLLPSVGSNNMNNYKVVLCHQWLTNGICPRGLSCTYAHGTAEIRQRVGEIPSTIYKKEFSKFWLNGKSSQNEQCNYSYGQPDFRNFPSEESLFDTDDFIPQYFGQPNCVSNSSDFFPSIPFSSSPQIFNSNGISAPHKQDMSKPPPSTYGKPFLVSNPPPPPSPPPMLWGQPPPQTALTMSSLLKPCHFQPLTGYNDQPSSLDLVQKEKSNTSVEDNPSKVKASALPTITKNIQPSSPPISMAKVAQQFESMSLYNPLPKEKEVFNTNDDADFPSLGSNANKPTEISEQTQIKTAQLKSFANIAAKAPSLVKKQSNSINTQTVKFRGSISNSPPSQPQPPQSQTTIIPPTNPLMVKQDDEVLLDIKQKEEIQISPSLTFEQFNNKIEENNNFSEILGESQFDDLFERDPYLNHLRNVEEDMFLQMKNVTANENFVIPEPPIIEKKVETEPPPQPPSPRPPSPDEWQTVVSRRRKTSCNTEEDYSDEDDFDCENANDGIIRSDSPASSIAQRSDNVLERTNGGSHLDNKHIFYRTHICIFWQNWHDGKGPKCRHGEDCFYAHGSKKLRKLNPVYYKTVLCEKFNNGDKCPYGENCNFAHGERELKKFSTTAQSNNNIISTNNSKELRKFFAVSKRYQIRKQRGTETIQCNPVKHFDKVKVLKTKGNGQKSNIKK